MKIALLSRNRKLYSSRRIIEAAEERDHEIVVIDVLRAYMNIAAHKPSIHYKGEELEDFDAVIPRIGASVTSYGTAVLRQFEMMGVVSLNESVAITRAAISSRTMSRNPTGSITCKAAGIARPSCASILRVSASSMVSP